LQCAKSKTNVPPLHVRMHINQPRAFNSSLSFHPHPRCHCRRRPCGRHVAPFCVPRHAAPLHRTNTHTTSQSCGQDCLSTSKADAARASTRSSHASNKLRPPHTLTHAPVTLRAVHSGMSATRARPSALPPLSGTLPISTDLTVAWMHPLSPLVARSMTGSRSPACMGDVCLRGDVCFRGDVSLGATITRARCG
jgi:hypothetical protein